MTTHLDFNDKATQKAYADLEDACRTMIGTNFALLMRHENGELEVFRRPSQPCQGGEMRKYKSSHGDDCTRPQDYRPGDLRMPFPKGTPEAVGFHFNGSYHGQANQADLEKYIDTVFGPDSMYLRGFGSPEAVKKVYTESGKKISGIILTDTEVDSTVLVNSMQFFRSGGSPAYLKKLLEIGFNEKEALIVMYLNGYGGGNFVQKPLIGQTYNYYFSVSSSLRRLFEADPHDLTGGTFRNRFDYNRPEVQDLFKAKDNELVFNWANEMKKKTGVPVGLYGHGGTISYDKFVSAAKELFDEFYHKNGGLETVVEKTKKTPKKAA